MKNICDFEAGLVLTDGEAPSNADWFIEFK